MNTLKRKDSAKKLDTSVMVAEIEAELDRARAKFPGRRLMSIALFEEVGELAKALLDEDAAHVRAEAVQVAVMAIRVALDGDEIVDGWREKKGLDFVGTSLGEAEIASLEKEMTSIRNQRQREGL